MLQKMIKSVQGTPGELLGKSKLSIGSVALRQVEASPFKGAILKKQGLHL